ncbi:MAG: cation-transporting P-type ATPase [candidate division NC10 bacterium]
MARELAFTPFLTGDPVALGAEVSSLPALARELGLPSLEGAGVLGVGPRVALIHSLTGAAPGLAVRVVRLPHAPPITDTSGPVDTAIVLTSSVRESGVALRLVSRLKAGLRDPALAARLAAPTTREELVRLLVPLDDDTGETPLAGDELFALLASGRGGLPRVEAARRLELCGPNQLERVRRRSLAARLLEQFVSFFAVLLWVGGGFAFLAGMPELGWAIFAVIVVNGVFSFFQEYRAERAVEALQELLPHEITVARGGEEWRLPAVQLVPGDLVSLEDGDRVPADGQLLSADGLRADQSALTGESHPVFKLPVTANERERVPRLERHELVFAGTGVVAGRGTCIVTATAMTTEIGAVARLTQAVLEEPSPLQYQMARVTRVVTFLAVTLGVGFFLLGVATGALSPAQGFLFALGVVVANVPEGLLPTLTLALALAVGRMARQGSLIKRLSAVETLGAATVICTDKTGTLTQGRMTARALVVGARVLPADALAADASLEIRELLEAAVLASQATAEHGDPTEVALVAAAASIGVDPEKARRAHELRAAHPFDSFRKRMTLVRYAAGGAVAYVKGAPKETLALCETIRRGGTAVALTDDIRRAVLAEHDRLAAEGLRMLAVATRRLPVDGDGATAAVESELTLLGIVGLWDPPRPEVEGAIAACRSAGIRVIMVTGDYGLTAGAIARQIGLPVAKVVTGDEVERMSPGALRGLVGEPGVLFARTSPAHKLAIVTALKEEGEVVAVTGDGVNDAPALKAAAIGVAMGRRGTEVAKEAAEMVIADDNFASIVAAIRQGRAIYANMGKFVTYIFASNVPELVPFLAFVFLGVPLPLTVMQILAVDLGTDLLPALALAAEPPEPGVMDRPPRSPKERLLSAGRLARAYGFLGVIEAALSLGAFFWTYRVAGWRPGLPMAASGDLYRRATTMTLAGIVATQVGNVFACRTDRESVLRVGLLANRLALGGIAAELAILLALILLPPFPYVFGLAPLAFAEWGVLLLFPPAVLLLEEGRKWVVRRTRPR